MPSWHPTPAVPSPCGIRLRSACSVSLKRKLWASRSTSSFRSASSNATGTATRRPWPTGQTKYGNDVLRVPAVHKDGHGLSIAFTVALLHTLDKKVAAIVAVIRDETARFTEDRNLRKRLMELESQLAPQASTP